MQLRTILPVISWALLKGTPFLTKYSGNVRGRGVSASLPDSIIAALNRTPPMSSAAV